MEMILLWVVLVFVMLFAELFAEIIYWSLGIIYILMVKAGRVTLLFSEIISVKMNHLFN